MSEASEISAADKMAAFIAAHGLTMVAEFIPYSAAKAKREDWSGVGKPWQGLTWRVRILAPGPADRFGARAPREILATDYSAGVGHTPAYRRKADSYVFKSAPYSYSRARDELAAWEIEHGKPARYFPGGSGIASEGKAAPLLPDFADVLASLAMDASVLDEPGFEAWADSLGYDTDSRKAEAIYRACLEIALKLRAALGEAGLEALRDAAADY